MKIMTAPFLLLTLGLASTLLADNPTPIAGPTIKPNMLIVTVDDMNCDSIGAFGCKLTGTSPHIDELAQRGMRYEYAHVQVGNCMPSRNVMFSGRYPHNNGVEGFYQVKNPPHPFMVDLLQEAGYFVGIRGKVPHSSPYLPYSWDKDLTTIDDKKQDSKNAESYYRSTKRGIELAQAAKKPFCLNVNISDPHKPFVKMTAEGKVTDRNIPSKVFLPDEVPVPGFLFDDPAVRLELAEYYSSVRRADDCFGEIMRALNESGQADKTVVMFLSDHGMPLPFAKTQLYHHSTRTPWIVHWPGVTKPGSIDAQHMISAVDLLPTLLEIARAEVPDGLDGKTFLPTVRGETQSDRDWIYKVYNENSGGARQPIRGVQSKQFLYLFNPWSDGKRLLKGATLGTATYKAMQQVATEDKKVAERLELFEHRVLEEFYDVKNDPDCLNNLIDDDDPKVSSQLQQHQIAMQKIMQDANDPMLAAFEKRDDAKFVSDYVDEIQTASDLRRVDRRQGKRNKKAGNGLQKTARSKQQTEAAQKLFSLHVPESVSIGKSVKVKVEHRLTDALGKQLFHVTMKDAEGKRLDRKVVSAKGQGELIVEFELPSSYSGTTISVSAFVGDDYQKNLLHRTESAISVK